MPDSKSLRADAVRNRDKLVAAATREFAGRGLDAPFEHIARRAGVSIGTLYAHFPTREALYDAIIPGQLAGLQVAAEQALAADDPWEGFVIFLEGLFALQAKDRGLNDALARRISLSPAVIEACQLGMQHADRIIGRAKEAGQLRPDFESQDLAPLISAMSQVIRDSTEIAPELWRRSLAFFLDGLRASAAHPVAVPALTESQLQGLLKR
jgi:AcrR family transcriptional regulator